MEPDSFALRTGIFLVVAGALLALSVMLFTRGSEATASYEIRTDRSVSGLDTQSRVYYKGVDVGLVASISFDPADFNVVRILIQIDERIPLGANVFAELTLRGITGEYDLTLDNEGDLGAPLDHGSGPPQIPLRLDFIERVGVTLESALVEIRALAENLKQLTASPNRDRVAELLTSLTAASDQLGVVAGRIEGTLGGLPEAVDAFTEAMEGVDATAARLASETSGLDELIASLDDSMTGLTRLLAVAENETLNEVDDTLVALRVTLSELSELARSLQRDPQSLLLGQERPPPGPGERRGGGQ